MSIKTIRWEGVWTALATPFNETFEIDWESLDRLLEHQIQGGVTGLVLAGSTGEAPTLTTDEKLAILARAKKKVHGSPVQLLLGTGGSDTRSTIELSKQAMEAGADGLLVVTPPYNKPNRAGLLAHYEAIAQAIKAPICLYHVPGRTAQRLEAEVIAEISTIQHVESVKEASGDIALFSKALLASKVPFLTGDDPTYLASLAVGGEGVISVISNILPREMVALGKAYRLGKVSRALAIHNAMMPLLLALGLESNPITLKVAMSHLGFGKNVLRLPLVPAMAENQAKIQRILEESKLIIQASLLM